MPDTADLAARIAALEIMLMSFMISTDTEDHLHSRFALNMIDAQISKAGGAATKEDRHAAMRLQMLADQLRYALDIADGGSI